ncbi:MAG: InlB B-repeat-containing protein, partial [Clostridia bacterium]|nr:InlB B-repeat-containing protein [Clostridia bacterium]
MKKSRKWISLLLSAIMVLTVIPFSLIFAPKAQAATAGSYTLDVIANCHNDAYASGMEVTVWYKPNNGTGDETSMQIYKRTDNFTWDGSGNDNRTNVSIPGFPTRVRYEVKKRYGVGKLEMSVTIKVNGVNLGDSNKNDWTSSGWHEVNWYVSDGQYPYANSMSSGAAISGATELTIPKTGASNVTSSYTNSGNVLDQYGVSWYQDLVYYLADSEPQSVSDVSDSFSTSKASIGGTGSLTLKPACQIEGTTNEVYAWVCAKRGNAWLKMRVKFIDPKYTVTYKKYDGSGTAATESVYYGSNATRTSAVASRTGYTFQGWNASTNQTSGTKPLTNITADQTVYEAWTINTSTLKVDPNSGTWNGSTSTQSYTQNYNTTKAIPLPTRNGYSFTGWTRTNTYGSLSSTTAAATYTFGATNGVTDTITAGWNINTYTITYDSDGGTTYQPLSYKITDTSTLPTPTKRGFTFLGWQPTSSVGSWNSGTKYAGGTSVNNKWGTVTLKAQWSKDPYTIGYDLAGGSLPAGQTNPTSYDCETDDFTLVNPTKTGYRFKGWSGTDLTGDSNTSVTLTPSVSTFPLKNRSYTANWNVNVYTVAFDKNDSSSASKATGTTAGVSKTYGVNETLTANGFVRGGYTFRGWATSADGAKVYDDGATLTTDLATENGAVVTLYAVWEPIDYTLTFDTDGGDAMAA